MCEAAGLKTASAVGHLENFTIQSAWDETMAVMARIGPDGHITVLYDPPNPDTDRHRDFLDDPTMLMAQEKHLWYFIVEIQFGTSTGRGTARRMPQHRDLLA